MKFENCSILRCVLEQNLLALRWCTILPSLTFQNVACKVKKCNKTKSFLILGDVDLKKSELGDVVTKINKLRHNQLEVLQMKNAIQKNMTALYGQLAGSIKGLGHNVALGNDLLRAQHALQMAIDTLGLVKTIFLNNRHYWIQVTNNARSQGSSGDTTIVLKVRILFLRNEIFFVGAVCQNDN